VFSKTKLGYRAWSNNNRLVSDLEPVMESWKLGVGSWEFLSKTENYSINSLSKK
jgi:hypothetical protein